jgi:hypothetical protein
MGKNIFLLLKHRFESDATSMAATHNCLADSLLCNITTEGRSDVNIKSM